MTHLTVIPRTTEKAYGKSQENVYIFDVPVSANKQQIIAAIESQFEIKITRIKTLVQKGKAVRFSRGKNRYPGTTNRSDSKKAYVTLAEGSSLTIFDQPAEEPAKKAKEEKK